MKFQYGKVLFFFLSVFLTQQSFCEQASCLDNKNCDVGVKTSVFFDKSRERPIITEIYYPIERDLSSAEPTSSNFKNLRSKRNASMHEEIKKLPLIVFSHSHCGSRYDLEWLQVFLAANGYIVASIDHFGDTHYLQRAEDSIKNWNCPKDITYLINQLLDSPSWKPHIDAERIGFVGFSLGTLTGIWLAGGIAENYKIPEINNNSTLEKYEGLTKEIIEKIDFSKAKNSYLDKRIKTELLLSPIDSMIFSQESLAKIDIPIMIIAAQTDKVAPVKSNARYLTDHIKSSAIKILPGTLTHDVFLSFPNNCSFSTTDKKELKEENISTNRKNTQEQVKPMALKFFHRYLKNSNK